MYCMYVDVCWYMLYVVCMLYVICWCMVFLVFDGILMCVVQPNADRMAHNLEIVSKNIATRILPMGFTITTW